MSNLHYLIQGNSQSKFEVIGKRHCGNGNDALYKTCDTFNGAVDYLLSEKGYDYHTEKNHKDKLLSFLDTPYCISIDFISTIPDHATNTYPDTKISLRDHKSPHAEAMHREGSNISQELLDEIRLSVIKTIKESKNL
jgi:hypothetical protein